MISLRWRERERASLTIRSKEIPNKVARVKDHAGGMRIRSGAKGELFKNLEREGTLKRRRGS